MRTGFRFASLVTTLALLGCESEPTTTKPPTGAFVRLDPRPVAGAPAWSSYEVVLRSEPLLEPALWSVDAPGVNKEARFDTEADFGEAPEILVLAAASRDDEVRLTRTGDYDTTRFNRVRVTGGFYGNGTLLVKFVKQGRVVHATKTRVGHEAGERSRVFPHTPRRYELDVPLAVRREKTCDEIVLELYGDVRGVRMHALELLDRSPEAQLPDPADGASDVIYGTDRLQGRGVSDRIAIETEFVAPAAGELRFAYGPAITREPEQDAQLVVALAGGSGETEIRYDLSSDSDAWTDAYVPILMASDGQPLTVRFRVESSGAAACAIAGVDLVPTASGDAPTVLLVTTDTHRGDHIGYADYGISVNTPNLDAIGAQGVIFDRCFTSTNSTNPSHVALMTGEHPRDTRILDNYHTLADRAQTLAEFFRDRGYLTWASLSAMHLEIQSGLTQGFDRISAPRTSERRAAPTVDRVVEWLPARAGRPLFLWVHVFDAHHPYDPPPGFEQPLIGTPHPVPAELTGTDVREFSDVREALAKYRGEVEYLDRELGRLFDAVDVEDAWVAFVGDHGESFGAHGLYFTHAGLYPDCLHVPLIVRGPGVPAGGRFAGLVAQNDVGRTLVELAGFADGSFPGRSLLRHTGAGSSPGEPFFALHSHALEASVSVDGYHLILTLEAGRDGDNEMRERTRHAVELYDLEKDPWCTEDLVSTETDRARAMRSTLIAWLRSAKDLGWEEEAVLDAETQDALRDLGYTGSSGAAADYWSEDDCEQCTRFQ